MKHWSHLNTATRILTDYDGKQPFAGYLRKCFNAEKKYGSQDRKKISQLCYSYFRLGKAAIDLPVEKRVLQGWVLCNRFNGYIDPPPADWIQEINTLDAREFRVEEIFPWEDQLSTGIDHFLFCQSFLLQPDLFLRVRPGYENAVSSKLRNAGIAFDQIIPSCLSLRNGSKVENVIELNREAVVQDYNSQQTGRLLREHCSFESSAVQAWDCCAASGGKSIMLHDLFPKAQLTVSDIRESILVNLKKRFAEAGIKRYHSFIADLSNGSFRPPSSSFDLIIADVPCTGSGTWSRTPEQLFYFNDNQIDGYAARQEKIVSNALPGLKAGGYLLYITCSVFRKENEGIIEKIMKTSGLHLVTMTVLKGYELKADSLFAAVLRRET